jgi:hypothetical protein
VERLVDSKKAMISLGSAHFDLDTFNASDDQDHADGNVRCCGFDACEEVFGDDFTYSV